jgi:hypothetical protein
MSDTLPARTRLLIGTASEWLNNDLVIGHGELVFESGVTGILAKVGNGFQRYSDLEFWPDPTPIMFTLRGEFAAADELLRTDLEGQLQQGYTTLNARITTEVEVLAGADIIIGQRIDTIQADLDSADLRLTASVTQESQARIAGDTALAVRSTSLEAHKFQNLQSLTSVVFGAYASLQAMVDDGFQFFPAIDSGRWSLRNASGAVGGIGLHFAGPTAQNSQTQGTVLGLPMTYPQLAPVDDPTFVVTVRVHRSDSVASNPTIVVGWRTFNSAGFAIPNDSGDDSQHGGAIESLPSRGVRTSGYARGRSPVGAGNRVGFAAPDVNAPTPFPTDARTVRPVVTFDGTAAGHQLFLSEWGYGPLTSTLVGLAGTTQDLSARVSSESQARVAGDTALATRIDSLEANFGTDLTQVNARITSESQVRAAADAALAQRSDVIEATSREIQEAGGNLLMNPQFTGGGADWSFSDLAWNVEQRSAGPARNVFVARRSGTLTANDAAFRPVPSRTLDAELVFARAANTAGNVDVVLDLRTVTGALLPSLRVPLPASTVNTPTRFLNTFELPDEAGTWRLALASAVTAGSIEIGAPFLGFRGSDFSTDLSELSARITDESQARIAGDTALATRSSRLESHQFQDRQALTSIIIGAYPTLQAMVEAGFNFWPVISSGRWEIVAAEEAQGGRALRFTGPTPQNSQVDGILFAPSVSYPATNLDDSPTFATTARGQRIDSIAPEPWVTVGWRARDAANATITPSDAGFDQLHGGLPAFRQDGSWSAAGYARGTANVGEGNRVGFAAPDISEPTPFPTGTRSLLPMVTFRGTQPGHILDIYEWTYGPVTSTVVGLSRTTVDLRASVADESQARVAGDTALATRASTLEARSLSTETAETTFDFAAFGSPEMMERAGWFFNPPVSTGAWKMEPNGSGIGGRSLTCTLSAADQILLRAPAFGLNPFDETYSGMWRLFRPDGGATNNAAAISVFAGWACFDADGTFLVSDGSSQASQVALAFPLQPLSAPTLQGYGRGRAAVGAGNGVGLAAPNLSAPRPFPNGTSRLMPAIQIIGTPVGLPITITGGRYGIVTRAAASNAAITDESQARVAGDTALASRSTALEARARASSTAEAAFDFGAYESIAALIAAGFEASPALDSGAWFLTVDGNAEGGRGLGYYSTDFTNMILYGPRTSFNPTLSETYGGRWQLFRNAGGADPAAAIQVYAGWLPYDAANVALIPSDFGSFHNQVAAAAPLLPGGVVVQGYGSGRAAAGAGNNVGRPSPDILDAAPFANGTTSLRPTLQLIGVPANTLIAVLNGRYGAVSRTADTRALIKTESTTRASADEALAQQIQTIIAEGAQGTKTFFQAAAPPNPEPGWVWFQDTGPGMPDNIFRWSGIAWDQINTADSADLAALEAKIITESTARVNGDNALSQRIAITESTVVSQGAAITATNARVTDETTARVNADNALAQRVTVTETTSQSNTNRLTVTEQATSAQGLKWSVRADANGRIAGIDLINGTTGPSLLSFLIDVFRVFNAATGIDEPVFEVRGGRVLIRQAVIDDLTVDQLRIDGNVLDSDATGALTIRRNGITTPLIAQNAIQTIYSYSQTTAGTQFTRNVWSTIVLNGAQAGVTIVNDPTGAALIRFDVSVLIRNFGSNSDLASFRIYRSDGFILTTQYTGVYIDDTPNNAYGVKSMVFFDIGVSAGAQHSYYFQMNSNEESIVRTVNILATLTKNSQTAPFVAPLLEDF